MKQDSIAPAVTPLTYPVSIACQRLGVGRSTLYELIKSKQLKTIKFGKRTLIPESELCRIVAEKVEAQA